MRVSKRGLPQVHQVRRKAPTPNQSLLFKVASIRAYAARHHRIHSIRVEARTHADITIVQTTLLRHNTRSMVWLNSRFGNARVSNTGNSVNGTLMLSGQ